MADRINERLELQTETKRQSPDSAGLYADPTAAGVTVAWLARTFDLDVSVVKSRLRHCPVKTQRSRGARMRTVLYDIKVAAPFLITPAFSTREYMRSLKRGDLPPALQQTIWDALLKRQQWETKAGHLWSTDKIREVLGGTFQTIKFTMQLWVEVIERQIEISPEQRGLIIELVDGLQQEIYDALVAQAAEGQTHSQLAELQDHTGEEESISEMLQIVESEEDMWDQEIGDLV